MFVVADENMKKEDIDVHEVSGLGIGTHIGAKGYIVICDTRQCNVAFYRWFNKTILIPTVNELRRVHELPEDAVAWYQLDGEEIQIRCYQDPTLLRELAANHICVGKPPGSTTEVTQPCDRGNLFKGSHTTNDGISDDDVRDNIVMLDKLKVVFKEHCARVSTARVPTAMSSSSSAPPLLKQMSAAHVKMAVFGLLRVQLAIQNTVKRSMIKDSFRLTGVYPFSLGQILHQCNTTITPDEQLNICAVLPKLATLMLEHGELKEADMDKCHIRGTTHKDNLVLNRRRSVILTCGSIVKAEAAKRASKQAAKDAKDAGVVKRKAAAEMKKASKICKI